MPQYLVQWPDNTTVSYVRGKLEDAARELDLDMSKCKVTRLGQKHVCVTFQPEIKSLNKFGMTRPKAINTEKEALNKFGELLKTGFLSDVTLEVAGHQIPAHKLILANGSPYFKAMFTLDMAEAKQKSVVIEGFNRIVMKTVLTFMYTGMIGYPSLDELSTYYGDPDEVLPETRDGEWESDDIISGKNGARRLSFFADVLQAADYFSMDSLTTLCSHFLYDTSFHTVSNYIKVFQLCKQYKLSEVKEHCARNLAFILSRITLRTRAKIPFPVNLLDVDEFLSQAPEDLRDLVDAICIEVFDIKPPTAVVDNDLYYSIVIDLGHKQKLDKEHVMAYVARGADVHRIRAFHLICDCLREATSIPADVQETINELVAIGYDLNQPDSEGRMPLHVAALGTNIELPQMLVKAGANPNAKDCEGRTPEQVVPSRNPRSSDVQCKCKNTANCDDSHGRVKQYLATTAGKDYQNYLEKLQKEQSEHQPKPTRPRKLPVIKRPEIRQEFIDHFLKDDAIVNSNMKYTMFNDENWPIEDTLSRFVYPTLHSQIERLEAADNYKDVTEAENKSIRQILESALKADLQLE